MRAARQLAGGVGDWGLLLPLSIALIAVNGLNATAVFAGVGLTYIATALYFRVPVPAQPLKAFAAAAIALELDAATLAAGALLMSLALGLLAASGLARAAAERFPLALTRGIQAAVALLLVEAALELAALGNWAGLPPLSPGLGVALALGGFVALLLARGRGFPGALLVLGAGALVGGLVGGLPQGLQLGPQAVAVALPETSALATALSVLVLAQLPLTFGNSIVATVDAEREYFGARARRVTPGRIAASIGLANAGAGLIGGLPVCHGAGGVTAHRRCGATGPAATAMAGAVLFVLALSFGASLPALLQVIAPGALAGMLLYTGFEHGLLASRVRGGFERAVVASVGLVTLLAGNLALGFLAGAVLLGARRAARAASGAGAAGARPGAAAPRRWRASGVKESAGPTGASGVPARGMGGEVTT